MGIGAFSAFGNKTRSQKKQITVMWRTAETKSHSFRWRSWNCASEKGRRRAASLNPSCLILLPLGPVPQFLLFCFVCFLTPLRSVVTHSSQSLFTVHSFHTCLVPLLVSSWIGPLQDPGWDNQPRRPHIHAELSWRDHLSETATEAAPSSTNPCWV